MVAFHLYSSLSFSVVIRHSCHLASLAFRNATLTCTTMDALTMNALTQSVVVADGTSLRRPLLLLLLFAQRLAMLRTRCREKLTLLFRAFGCFPHSGECYRATLAVATTV
jgi:hypothetical protein